MLNHITVTDRLTRDPELRHTQNGIPAASFSIACDRDFKDKNTGETKIEKAIPVGIIRLFYGNGVVETEAHATDRDMIDDLMECLELYDVDSFRVYVQEGKDMLADWCARVIEDMQDRHLDIYSYRPEDIDQLMSTTP